MTMPVESANKSASPPPEKNDRFRAEMPHIPGVGNSRVGASTSAANVNATRLLQIGGLAAFVLLIGGVFLWRVKSAPRGGAESPSPEAAAALSVPPPAAPASEAPETDGPTVAATAEELAKPWSAKQFTFVKPVTHEKLDAMVIRLPGGRLWAFALLEAYGHCNLEFVTNLGELAKQYGYRGSHPMVASPCSSTVYDPLKVSALSGDVFVRGEIVQGGGLRPPISIDVMEKGLTIIADRIE
jgi:hypothetical protein